MGKKFRIRPIKPAPEVTLLLAHEVVHNPSRQVDEDQLEGLKPMMWLMAGAIDKGGFPGMHGEGYALAHHQVSDKPFAFFVVREDISNSYFHGERVIINPQFEVQSDAVEEEKRETCLTHPFLGSRKVRRYSSIVARFITIDGKEKQIWLDGLAAQILQHEHEHTMGRTIWDDKV